MDHQGHRERLKQRFRQEGLDGFGDEKVLELLLFYIIPRRDTAPIARALLEQFGSLTGVLEASPMALTKVPGMGENAASFIQFIMALNRYYLIRQTAGRKKLTTLELCREYIWPRFLGLQEERVCALCLDAGCGVLGCKILGSGSVNSAAIPIRKIVEFALSANATSLVLAHNHPGGIAVPSQEDLDSTQKVEAALAAVGVILADHLIIADNAYVSLAESDLLRGIHQTG